MREKKRRGDLQANHQDPKQIQTTRMSQKKLEENKTLLRGEGCLSPAPKACGERVGEILSKKKKSE